MLEQLEPPTHSLRKTELRELLKQSNQYAHTLAIAYRRCPRNKEVIAACHAVKQLIGRIQDALAGR